MNTVKIIIAVLIMISAVLPAFTSTGQIDGIIQKIETALQNKDKATFVQVFNTQNRAEIEQLEKFIKKYIDEYSYQNVYIKYNKVADASAPEYIPVTVIFLGGRNCIIEYWEIGLKHTKNGSQITTISVRSVISKIRRFTLLTGNVHLLKDIVIKVQEGSLEFPKAYVITDNEADKSSVHIVLGEGEFIFRPSVDYEKNQMRLLTGKDYLQDSVKAAMLITKAQPLKSLFSYSSSAAASLPENLSKTVEQLWKEQQSRNIQMKWLQEIDRDAYWSFTIEDASVQVKMMTGKHGNLLYNYIPELPYPVQLLRESPNLIYAFYNPLQTQGQTFHFTIMRPFSIDFQRVQIQYNPDNNMIMGKVLLSVKSTSETINSIELFLNKNVGVNSVTDDEYRPLLFLKNNVDNILTIYLRKNIEKNGVQTIEIKYSGILESYRPAQDYIKIVNEKTKEASGNRYVAKEMKYYEGSFYWYPQSMLPEFSKGIFEITVPKEYYVLASGTPAEPRRDQNFSTYIFNADTPIKYFSFLVFKNEQITMFTLNNFKFFLESDSPVNEIRDNTVTVFNYYTQILGNPTYTNLNIYYHFADYEGGHSQAGFIVLIRKHPYMTNTRIKSSNPLFFPQYQYFNLTHELAHLWWGQSSGWLTYQDQWLSEGLAQYMTLQYIRHVHGEDAYKTIIRKCTKSVKDYAKSGPVILGRRLGLINKDNDSFGALVYNKAALGLIMLEDIIGREAVLKGIKEFYKRYYLQFATTYDFIATMEEQCSCNLSNYFYDWYFLSKIPQVHIDKSIKADSVELSIQVHPKMIVPLNFEILFNDGSNGKYSIVVEKTYQKVIIKTEKKVKKIIVQDLYPIEIK